MMRHHPHLTRTWRNLFVCYSRSDKLLEMSFNLSAKLILQLCSSWSKLPPATKEEGMRSPDPSFETSRKPIRLCSPSQRSLSMLQIGSAPSRITWQWQELETMRRCSMPLTTSSAPQGAGGKEYVPVWLMGKCLIGSSSRRSLKRHTFSLL